MCEVLDLLPSKDKNNTEDNISIFSSGILFKDMLILMVE